MTRSAHALLNQYNISPAYLCLGVLRRVLGCRGCALGLCQLLGLRVHLTLSVAGLLLQVVHDHLLACQGRLRSGCCRSCVLR
jgi:hypothetical protein